MKARDAGSQVPVEVRKDGPAANELQLLNHVHGSFEPGRMTALMGATGAGKTTLVDCLSGRKTGLLLLV